MKLHIVVVILIAGLTKADQAFEELNREFRSNKMQHQLPSDNLQRELYE